MRLPTALNATGMLAFLITLSLFNTGAAWGMAEVESRSQSQALSYAADNQNASLDTLKKLEFLQQEVQELRGKVEEQSYQLQQVQDHQKKLYLDLDKRLRDGGPSKASSSSISHQDNENSNTAKMQVGNDANNSSPFVTDVPDNIEPNLSTMPAAEEVASEEKAYQNAYRLIQNKDYEAALTAFKSMIQRYPQGKYAPNAQYWLGEIYLVKGSLELAGDAFNIVYRQYPQHPKAADSLLKLGYVEYAKGQWKRSQALLNQVKIQFPGSTSAQLADSRLQKMQQEGHL
jgi:tol-pal system protein YbgF